MTQNLLDLLENMEKIEIQIEGQRFEIPRGQPLLRGFQYLELKEVPITVTSGPFCWNGDCQSCLCDLEINGQLMPQTYACRHIVEHQIKVIKINENYDFEAEP
ncbi:MAG: (2Fe-2S)-binding protein [Acidobacteria bacterium]|nr:(2Fe-2S)-binding protein [Acidobacteriota bacterium]MCB9396432.1 (2Fe-2S)-binding protein [Acidobacteriota bacterium]